MLGIALALPILSCNKTPAPETPSCSTFANVVTITDGPSYCVGGIGEYQSNSLYGVNVITIIQNGRQNICISAGDNRTFDLQLMYAWGPIAGIGTYTLQPSDSSSNTYDEWYSSWSIQKYKIAGGTINVTQDTDRMIMAIFSLNIFNASGSRTITGTLAATNALTN